MVEYDLDRFYGLTLEQFDAKLRATYPELSIHSIIKLIQFEIDCLLDSYQRYIQTRDQDDFDVDFAVCMQQAIASKRQKLGRYQRYLEKSNFKKEI